MLFDRCSSNDKVQISMKKKRIGIDINNVNQESIGSEHWQVHALVAQNWWVQAPDVS